MRDLSDDQRIIFILHYWEDLTLDEVALRLSTSPGTVRSRLNAGLRRIRQQVEAQGPVRESP
jgi:RNA polymerase sigma factor (sigma-70 family)